MASAPENVTTEEEDPGGGAALNHTGAVPRSSKASTPKLPKHKKDEVECSQHNEAQANEAGTLVNELSVMRGHRWHEPTGVGVGVGAAGVAPATGTGGGGASTNLPAAPRYVTIIEGTTISYDVSTLKLPGNPAFDTEEWYQILTIELRDHIVRKLTDLLNMATCPGAVEPPPPSTPPSPPPTPIVSPLGANLNTDPGMLQFPVAAAPTSNTRPWHRTMTIDLRNQVIHKLVLSIYPTTELNYIEEILMHDLISYATKVERLMYETAISRFGYYHLIGEKSSAVHIFTEGERLLREKRQKLIEERLVEQREMELEHQTLVQAQREKDAHRCCSHCNDRCDGNGPLLRAPMMTRGRFIRSCNHKY